jgi:hypothetical protein
MTPDALKSKWHDALLHFSASPKNLTVLARGQARRYAVTMNREEIEQKMDELAREFAETHDPEVRDEIYRLAHQLKELDH